MEEVKRKIVTKDYYHGKCFNGTNYPLYALKPVRICLFFLRFCARFCVKNRKSWKF